jgi:Fe-S cluster assembly iron-binding protein IscA
MKPVTGEVMLTVTESASSHLAQLLSESEAPEEAAVRIAHDQDGWSLLLDNADPDDQRFEHNGKTVLVIDQESAEMLGDVTLDVQMDETEAHLTISPAGGEQA